MYTPKDVIDEPLHVVTCITNTVRYKSRWKLYRDFQRHVRESGAILHTVEAAFGERDWALEEHAVHDGSPNMPWKSAGPPNVPNQGHGVYTQLRMDHLQEIWLKENLLNIGVSRLPANWKYVAFIDADVLFTRPDWVSETLHQLQHYHVVQMFSDAIDLFPDGSPQPGVQQKGHAWCHVHGILNDAVNTKTDAYGPKDTKLSVSMKGGTMYRHPGFAWAWRREAFNAVGGLMDKVILGSADWHMAWGLLGRIEETISRPLTDDYRKMCMLWQRRAVEHIKYNVGYVAGTIMHQWHGPKRARGYATRWKILADNHYQPSMDVKNDWQGILRLTDTKPRLRDQCRQYFRQRNEDSIDP
jgi:hypothetical protein